MLHNWIHIFVNSNEVEPLTQFNLVGSDQINLVYILINFIALNVSGLYLSNVIYNMYHKILLMNGYKNKK